MPDSLVFPYYPINDFGPAMKGMVIGGLGIFHVFLAQFAIGGGLLMCYLEWLSQCGKSPDARRFVDNFFKLLVLISFVVGALTGVGMWFTSIQVSPRTIGLMVGEFHWIWAIEWTFFCLEIVSGYAFYRYGERLDDRSRLRLLAVYSLAAWFSLFWINGILSWQLTPGSWVETRNVWSGFFNSSFWPSLIFRTIVSMTIAALVACVVINTMGALDRAARTVLINQSARLLTPMLAMPLLGLWYFASIPADSRAWALGANVPMMMFLVLSIGMSLMIGLYAVFGLIRQKLYVNGATATLLCSLAFAATAGGEFVREGVRKPFTIRETLYSNSIRRGEVEALREKGSVTDDPYPLRHADALPSDQLRLGAKVFRFQCSVCHTLDGANALVHLAGAWSTEQKRVNIARLQRTKTFMPPFAGNPEECEALVQYLEWVVADSPTTWPVSDDRAVLARIQQGLQEAGTQPGEMFTHPARRESR
ncbi:MAG: cytochrome BD quinol oxidase subunit I [Planctomycetaceae bacterium]|nr:cytochrome BD quinol oxidase subunit I [Planctomycetaceae bacterium]